MVDTYIRKVSMSIVHMSHLLTPQTSPPLSVSLDTWPILQTTAVHDTVIRNGER